MSPTSRRSRRAFLVDFGRTSSGLIVVGAGLAGCGGGDPVVGGSPDPSAASASSATGAPSVAAGGSEGSRGANDSALVDLGFVAAYVVSRDGQATVIDTGIEGSEDAILAVLEELGLGWGAVSDIVVTHSHGDHAGSLTAVADAASDAAISGGEADIPRMRAPRDITVVGDGDRVFGMEIIETPGHTPGHISILDGDVLYTGDALVGGGDPLAGSPAEFTDDMAMAQESVVKLAMLDVATVNVFHGFPVDAGTADLMRLADSM